MSPGIYSANPRTTGARRTTTAAIPTRPVPSLISIDLEAGNSAVPSYEQPLTTEHIVSDELNGHSNGRALSSRSMSSRSGIQKPRKLTTTHLTRHLRRLDTEDSIQQAYIGVCNDKHQKSTSTTLYGSALDASTAKSLRSANPTSYTNQVSTITIDEDSGYSEDEDEIQMLGVRARQKRRIPVLVPRVLDESMRARPTIIHNGEELRAGTCVELIDGSFMKLHTIYEDKSDVPLIVGQIYTRASTSRLEMPRHRNAMVWPINPGSNGIEARLPQYHDGGEVINEVVQRIKTMPGENPLDYGLWRRPLQDVVCTRRLRATNQWYDDINCISSRHIHPGNATLTDIEETAVLVCRWKEVVSNDEFGKWKEQRLERLSAQEADVDWRETSEELRTLWRGYEPPRGTSENYTFADAYSGAGGVSQGAQEAGLSVVLAYDKDEKKIVTFRANHKNCRTQVLDVYEFIELARRKNWRIDVLHLSPPCQAFSPAHTRTNEEKDEQNQAPLLACADVIKCLRPRVVTVEETAGLLERHHLWFSALLHQFTDIGFSVRWARLRCSDFGVPQTRRRLFIVASAPGENLPPFPEPTHELGMVSIQTVLSNIEARNRTNSLQNHDPELRTMRSKVAYDPFCLAKTITCGGGQSNYHPNGLRDFTIRELAVLQTFPMWYKFGPYTLTELKIQIGNAVPPLLARAVLQCIVASLRHSDLERLANPRLREVIRLD